ncbi:YvrJ family protein [Bacillus massilinigeriensis]|uniref:YvrJ family protein n=1 Tax=Bacillus massilionigeriensis TaxID=1805475 RepID=UPI00096B3FDF|nr:YvrJ family protein [Bacillus massilionigeriensis]
MEGVDKAFMETLVATIGKFGFPLVLAVYLLLRFEKKIEVLTDAILALKEVITQRNRD